MANNEWEWSEVSQEWQAYVPDFDYALHWRPDFSNPGPPPVTPMEMAWRIHLETHWYRDWWHGAVAVTKCVVKLSAEAAAVVVVHSAAAATTGGASLPFTVAQMRREGVRSALGSCGVAA